MLTRFSRRAAAPLATLAQVRHLNIHEYQSKGLLKEAGCKVEYGIPVSTVEEAAAAIQKIKTSKVVVKSQILAGGRGMGTFVDGFKGGVHVCDSRETARDGQKMLGNTLSRSRPVRLARRSRLHE